MTTPKTSKPKPKGKGRKLKTREMTLRYAHNLDPEAATTLRGTISKRKDGVIVVKTDPFVLEIHPPTLPAEAEPHHGG